MRKKLKKFIKKSSGFTKQERKIALNKLTTKTFVFPYSNTSPKNGREIIFSSNFENGNLKKVVKNQNTFKLYISKDSNVGKKRCSHTFWFFFSVRNLRKGTTYTFKLMNIAKKELSPFVKIVCKSVKSSSLWKRYGRNISVQCDKFASVRFDYTPDHNGDKILFAPSFPFTYSMLTAYLDILERRKIDYVYRKTLCKSVGGNNVDVIIVDEEDESEHRKKKKKKVVVISAMVHPGESVSGLVAKGMINYIVSQKNNARNLRKHFRFVIVPALNPDGLIAGNYRHNMIGKDLNRVWENPNEKTTPSVYALKLLIEQEMKDNEIFFFVDLHGHSSSMQTFLITNPECSLFNYMFGRHFEKFSDGRCDVNRSKSGCGRFVLSKMGIKNSFTLESSIFGCKSIHEYLEQGKVFLELLWDYHNHVCPPVAREINVVTVKSLQKDKKEDKKNEKKVLLEKKSSEELQKKYDFCENFFYKESVINSNDSDVEESEKKSEKEYSSSSIFQKWFLMFKASRFK